MESFIIIWLICASISYIVACDRFPSKSGLAAVMNFFLGPLDLLISIFSKGSLLKLAICSSSTALILSTALSFPTFSQEDSPFASEIASLELQIEQVNDTISRYDSGIIRVLAETRREALLLLRTMLEARQQAELNDVPLDITLPAVKPDPVRADQLIGEMATVLNRIIETEKEAAGATGLMQALALSRLETEKLILAQLQMGYLQAHYGIAFPAVGAVADKSDGASNTAAAASEGAGEVSASPEAMPWADPNYPNIDYSLSPFESAHQNGEDISGWWTIEQKRAAIDDSPIVVAVNYSAYESQSFGGLTALIARCREGKTSFLFLQDDFLIGSFERSTLDIIYRIDDQPAQSTRWSELTSSQGAGLFGSESEGFIRNLYDANNFFIRIIDSNGQRHDAEFDLAGIKTSADAIASACGWSTLELSRNDYRAIQTLLNAGGYNTGTPDGVWSTNSKTAMRAYQLDNNLRSTGAPDRATLQTLGIHSSN